MSRFKKLFVLLCVISLIAALTGCTTGGAAGAMDDGTAVKEEALESRGKEHVPELSQVQEICELAALECYYHNVAKSVKEPGTGVVHFGEKERPFWMEYTGIAEISFKSDLIKMEQNGQEIIITLPPPEITCKVDPDSWSEDSYVISKDQWIQKNPITAEDQTEAIKAAQADMQEMVENNPSILKNARTQARDLISNYIQQIGRAAGVEYQISWIEQGMDDMEGQPPSAGEVSEDGN